MGEDPNNLVKKGEISRRLHHPEEEIRRLAVDELKRRHGAENLALLSEGLGDLSWRVRKTAIDVIVNYPDQKSSTAILINALYDHENAGRRTSAIEALIRMGERSVDELLQACQTYDPEVRKFLLDILGEVRHPKSLPCVLKNLDDPDENVRLAAVEALGKIGGQEADKKLMELINSGNDLVIRFSALHLLGKSGKPFPAGMVERLLKERLFRRAVFEVLGGSSDPQSVSFLLEGIADSAKSARQAAIHSMTRIYEKDQAGNLRPQIEQGLRKIFNHKNLSLLVEFIEGDHAHTRRNVLTLLSLLDLEQSLHYLFSLSLNDSLSEDLAANLERIRQRRPDWFKKQLKGEVSEIKEAVKHLLKEEEGILSLTEEAKPQLSEAEFSLIRDRISLSYGIFFDLEMKYLVERRIAQRMHQLGDRRFSDYLIRLENSVSGQEELNELTRLLVNNETYFFREDFQLQTFSEEIMPELIESARQEGRESIRIWSAGCSSGEEPYTIAMLIAERKDLGKLKVEIYGSDLSEEMIKKAGQGVYGPSSFRVIDEYHFKKYFSASGHKFQVQDQLRKMVQFDCLNLLSFGYPAPLRNLDVIFCRNVLIYFSLEAKRALVERFYQSLRWGGFLLLGHSESLLNLSTAFRLRHFKNDLVHQKPPLEDSRGK